MTALQSRKIPDTLISIIHARVVTAWNARKVRGTA